LSENNLNIDNTSSEVIGTPILNDLTPSYKKNLMRLLVLSGMGIVTIILLAISLFLVGTKIF